MVTWLHGSKLVALLLNPDKKTNMKSQINLPGFTADVNLDVFNSNYYAISYGSDLKNSSAITPQYAHRHCGPCRNGRRLCIVTGFECHYVPGPGGSDELGIPPGEGHVRCEPVVLNSWWAQCPRVDTR